MTTESLLTLLGKAENRFLLTTLIDANVELIVIGGTALAHHGLRDPMDVDDLDLLVNSTTENSDKIVVALQSLSVPLTCSSAQLARPAIQVPIKNFRFWAELLTPLGDLKFKDIEADSITIYVEGRLVHVASTGHLKIMKQMAVKQLSETLKKHETDLRRLNDA